MNCKETKKYLPLDLREIPPAIREEMQKHLQQCPACRELAENLNCYRTFAESAEEPDVPEDFSARVLDALESEGTTVSRRPVHWKAVVAVSAAAAILLILVIVNGIERPWRKATEVSFLPNMEKQGKGSAGFPEIQAIDAKITALLTETGASVEKVQHNPLTGYYDYMIIGIPGKDMEQFAEEFNLLSAKPISMPDPASSPSGTVYIKVYFDMIRFTAGKFNQDSRADLLVQFISGKEKGKWVVWLNDDSLQFSRRSTVDVGRDEAACLGDFRLLAGDFDGDSLDDLCMYRYSIKEGLVTHFLRNEGNLRFQEDEGMFGNLTIPARGDFIELLSGDADGDGRDDLLWVSGTGEGIFNVSAINLNRSFNDLLLPEVDSGGGVFLAGDFNADGYSDLCVKYLNIYLHGNTDILLNQHDFAFAKPLDGGLSFQGDYSLRAADFDGDGFCDLLVKSGGPFLTGDWYIMRNNQMDRFTFLKLDNPD